MNRILLTLIVPIILFACKKDDIDPVAGIEPVAGSWRQIAVERIVEGKTTWEDVSKPESNNLHFRNDGVVTDMEGKANCCGPSSLNINGNIFKIKPTTKLNYSNCALDLCLDCQEWKIEVTDNELILNLCGSSKTKYVRL